MKMIVNNGCINNLLTRPMGKGIKDEKFRKSLFEATPGSSFIVNGGFSISISSDGTGWKYIFWLGKL